MSKFDGGDVNSVLRHVRALAPGGDAAAGERQLSIMATALCVAARSCGVDRDVFMDCLSAAYDDAENIELVPLTGAN
ncbi:MAG: hypothetical protein AAFR84_00870 [Pseudomonadota bacterium]